MHTVPPSPRHPGRILEEDYLSRLPHDATQGAIAERLSMSRPRLNDLIHGRRSVTLDTALRLARCFGTPPELWLRAQLDWDLHQARRSRARMREIERIEPLPLAAPPAPPPRGPTPAPAGEPAAADGGAGGTGPRTGGRAAAPAAQTELALGIPATPVPAPGARRPQPDPAPAPGAAAADAPAERSLYYEEFLRRRGMLEEARRFARIQAQLDVLEPHRPDARRRLQRAIRFPEGALALPPLPRRGAARELPSGAAGGIL